MMGLLNMEISNVLLKGKTYGGRRKRGSYVGTKATLR